MRPPRSVVAALALLCLAGVAAAASGRSFAAFSGSASNSSPTLRAAADWTPPSASRSVMAKSSGGEPGYVRPGGTYHAYAQVSDSGNPAAGMGSVTASSALGSAALTTSGGPWTIGGQTYNYRSAQQTAPSVAAANHPYTLALSDANSPVNSQTQAGFSVVVDATAPAAANIQTANGGAIAGRPDQGDTVTFTFTEPVEPASILAGWDGSATAVTLRVANNVSSFDRIQVRNAASTAQLPITDANGASLGRTDYVSSTRNFSNSTMVRSGNAITITLGTQSGAGTTAGGNGTMSWAPLAAVTDRAGNASSTAAATESGAADRDF